MPGLSTQICDAQQDRSGAKSNCKISTLVKCFLHLPHTICGKIEEPCAGL
jgi:hypothetical protein